MDTHTSEQTFPADYQEPLEDFCTNAGIAVEFLRKRGRIQLRGAGPGLEKALQAATVITASLSALAAESRRHEREEKQILATWNRNLAALSRPVRCHP